MDAIFDPHIPESKLYKFIIIAYGGETPNYGYQNVYGEVT
jgi:hypothetical protein